MTGLIQFSEIKSGDVIVEMVTNMGTVQIKMFPEVAPKTVANFVAHAKSGYYEGIIFHRVIKDFMIQGGDPTGTGMGGTSIYGEKFEDEFSMDLCHFHGALSMANAGPNTNGSQFFIVHASKAHATEEQLVKGGWTKEQAAKYAEIGGTPHLDGAHTVFGQVVVGLDVVDAIAKVKVGSQDRPKEDVKIVKMNVIE